MPGWRPPWGCGAVGLVFFAEHGGHVWGGGEGRFARHSGEGRLIVGARFGRWRGFDAELWDDGVGGGVDGAVDGDAGRGGEAGEEVELGALEEAELDPAEEVIHDGLGVADLLVAGPAGGFEAGVGELFAEELERDSVLEGEGDGGGEGIHEAGDGGAFFGHADEDFAGALVGVEADGEVALVAGDGELVGDGGALRGEAVTDGAGRGLGVAGVGILLRGGGFDGGELRGELGDGGLVAVVRACEAAARSSCEGFVDFELGGLGASGYFQVVERLLVVGVLLLVGVWRRR